MLILKVGTILMLYTGESRCSTYGMAYCLSDTRAPRGTITFLTIGFGDYTPKTHLGRSLFFPTAVGGILFVGLIIADIRSLVLESASVKISTRMVEKARHKALVTGDPADGHIKLRGRHSRRIDASTELERREQEFEIMHEVLEQATKDTKRITLAISTVAFFLIWIMGAVVFWQAELATGGDDWTYFESLYFTYVSLLTASIFPMFQQTVLTLSCVSIDRLRGL